MAWDEVSNGIRGAAVRPMTVTAAGTTTFGPVQKLATGAGAYPMLAARPNGLFAVWTSGPPNQSTIRARVLR